jgi:hypothetical protein
MDECRTGMLARSLAGHDKNKIYVITGMEGAYIYLVDGRLRPVGNPKKKKYRHVQVIKREYDIREADDAKIRRILREWNKEEVKQED